MNRVNIMVKDSEIIKVAEASLCSTCLNNTLDDLDLPCRLEFLEKTNWDIRYHTTANFFSIPLYNATIKLLYQNKLVATYKLYLDKELNILDEFFITHV